MLVNQEINKLRKKIDIIDTDIIDLLLKRKELTSTLIQHKIENRLPVLDKNREEQIISTLIETNSKLNPVLIRKFFSLIFSDSKRQYYKLEKLDNISDYINFHEPLLIAGPCVVEDENQINNLAEELSNYGIKFLRGGAFKPRTSPYTFQGLGDLGVELLYKAARRNNMFTVTEVLEREQLEKNYDMIDIVQIGSRNMTSYGLLKSIGKVTEKDKKYILLKRGFSATITEFLQAAEYILQAGNPNVILCLRGIRTFEQMNSRFRFTPDLASILELKEKTTLPVIFDASHSTGCGKFVINVSNAALELGADGLMIETHNNPRNSKVDAE